MEERKCTTHHHACDCREEKIKRLVKAIRAVSKLFAIDAFLDKEAVVLTEVLKEWEGEFER